MRRNGLNVVPSKSIKGDGCPALSEGPGKEFHQPSALHKKGAACFLLPLKHQISKFLRKINYAKELFCLQYW